MGGKFEENKETEKKKPRRGEKISQRKEEPQEWGETREKIGNSQSVPKISPEFIGLYLTPDLNKLRKLNARD